MLRLLLPCLLVVPFVLDAELDAQQEKRTGTLTGTLKASKPSPNGKNVIIEVLAPGEEKARTYRVQYDPAIKAPIAKVLDAVKAAKVGDRVRLEWIDTGEGLAMKEFQVLSKKD